MTNSRERFFSGVGIGVGIAIVLLLVFFAGLHIGRRQAGLFPFWERPSMHEGFVPRRFGHGSVGTIESIGDRTFVVKDRVGAVKTILVDDHTLFRRDKTQIGFLDLQVGDNIMVIGEPQEDEGTITARVVRAITDKSDLLMKPRPMSLLPGQRRGLFSIH